MWQQRCAQEASCSSAAATGGPRVYQHRSLVQQAPHHQRQQHLGKGARALVAVRAVDRGFHHTGSSNERYDLVLSSGFLAFANHSGFLQAVEEAGLRVGGVMGTSAGALAGSLYCAGYTPRQVAMHLSRETPISLLRPSLAPWRGGVLSLDGVIERLRELLPPRFEDLKREFAVGVVTAEGEHLIIDRGPLPEAVAASAAIPFIFENVDVALPGSLQSAGPYKDGGVVDRVGLRAWRDRRRLQLAAASHHQGGGGGGGGKGLPAPPPCLVHVISRSSPFSGSDDTSLGESNVYVVRSPKSGVNFFSLGDFESHMSAAVKRARPALEAAAKQRRDGVGAGSKSPERNRRLVTPA